MQSDERGETDLCGWQIAVDSTDNIIVAGSSWNGSDYDMATLKYSAGGSLLGMKVYDSGKDDLAYAVARDSNNNIIVILST